MRPDRRLQLSLLASLGLHIAALASAAALLSPPTDHYLTDARRGPRLEVTMVAAAPPAFVIDAALRPMEEVIAAFSKRGARRESPGAPREAPPAQSESLYYSAREVDVRAAPLGDIVPINPDLSGRESGTVVLRLLINARGTVDYVMVARAEPQRPFGGAVLLPFRNARFSPARKNGVPVNSEMLIELRYGALERAKR